MNERALEHEIRAWFAAEIDETVVAPSELRVDVLAIPRREGRSPTRPFARPSTLLIAAAIATTAIVGSAIVGSGLLRTAPPTPRPSIVAVTLPSPSPQQASRSTEPSESVEPTRPAILGGGLILASLEHPGERPCHATAAPFDIVTVDPGTAATTVLGTTSSACKNDTVDVHWAKDRTAIILLHRYSPRQIDLPIITDAGRQFPLVCCDLPTKVWEGGGGGGQNWVVSPHGDRVAAVHTTPSDRGDGIVVSDVDGSNARTLLLPRGADAYGFSWSPDESVIAVTACQSCGTADDRGELLLVPVDGSAVRTLVTPDPGAGIGFAAWAPDGRTIASVASACVATDPPPCSIEHQTSSLVTIDVATGVVRHVAEGSEFGHSDVMLESPSWSPDGGRLLLAVGRLSTNTVEALLIDPDDGDRTNIGPGVPRSWAPDGEWILVGHGPDGTDLWIVPIAGGDARHLGEFLSADW